MEPRAEFCGHRYRVLVRELAGSFEPDRPGLPRGRAKLSAEEVRDAQRRRILRATIAATAQKGIRATTVSDIVQGARVSRQAFYQQFDDKEACLIAAVDNGTAFILGTIKGAAESTVHLPARQRVSALVETYLAACDAEPEFARTWAINLPLAGEAGLAKRNEYLSLIAQAMRSMEIAQSLPDDEPSPSTFLAAVGGCHELFYRHALASDSPYSDLHGPIVDFLARLFQL